MCQKILIQNVLTHTFLAVTLATLLSACHKEAEPANNTQNQPVISGDTIRFAVNSPFTQRIITAPVVAAQDNVLKLPARIVWDEDHTARISSPIAGRLSSILVQIGAEVKAGQSLAYLSSPDLGSAQADTSRAKTDLSQAERIQARDKELVEAGIIASKELEQAQSDVMRSKAEAIRTEVRLKSLGGASAVDQKFTIKSPISGILVERNTNPGMEWRPDQTNPPLFIVSDPSYLWCWIDAPEDELNAFKKGEKVQLRASALPSEIFEGQIDFISDGLDPVSRTLKVRAKLRNPLHRLKDEMYVTAELNTSTPDTLDIPAKAVFLKKDAQMVFVKTSEGIYIRKEIHPVASNDEWVSINNELNKGDQVVLDGTLYLEKLLDESAAQPISNDSPSNSLQLNQKAK